MQRSDEYLLELAIGGDGGSFGELVQRWESRIFGFIRRYVGNTEEARDLTQDTFSKAYQNIQRLSDPARFSSWLYKIALNECRMRFRRLKGNQQVSIDDFTHRVDALEGTHPGPEKVLARKERAEQLHRAFERLPNEQKEVILMKEYQGLRFHEISEVLGIPLSTAKSRMYLGLKTLKKLLEEME